MTAARILVEYVWDDEARAWGFVVPALHIVGGGPTREDARQRARDAIAVALETAEVSGTPDDAEYLNVQVG
jgi:predicted RNase H-like HicB family nuclease